MPITQIPIEKKYDGIILSDFKVGQAGFLAGAREITYIRISDTQALRIDETDKLPEKSFDLVTFSATGIGKVLFHLHPKGTKFLIETAA